MHPAALSVVDEERHRHMCREGSEVHLTIVDLGKLQFWWISTIFLMSAGVG